MKLHNFDFSKKIFFHPEKIVQYKEGKRPFPIMIEIDLANICNHKCSFCNCADTLASGNSVFDTSIIMKVINEAYELGTRAVSFTGGGEPMVHKDFVSILEYSKNLGLDLGCITNGSLIRKNNIKALVNELQWIRISMAGGDRDTYRKVQGIDHFEKVINNIDLLVKENQKNNSNLNIGVKILINEENIDSILNLAELLVDTNIDYLQVIPDQFSTDDGEFWYSKNTQDKFDDVTSILQKKNVKLLNAGFSVKNSQDLLDYPSTCYAHFFQAVITADGDLIFCKNCREQSDFHIGNVHEKSLKEIWEGQRVKDIEKWVRPNNCGLFCKNMALNTAMEETLFPDISMTPNFVN